MNDKENTNFEKKIYPVGTSGMTYMVFIGLSISLIYLLIFLVPSFFASHWWGYPLLIGFYLSFYKLFRSKGEKLIVTGDSIEFKGLLTSKKLKISEIASFKVMSSSFSGNSNIIIINPKSLNKEKIKVGSLPKNDLSEFIEWLGNHVEKEEGLKLDKNQDRIGEEDGGQAAFNLKEPELALKSYPVGKKIFPMVFVVISLSFLSGLLFLLNLDLLVLVYLLSVSNFLIMGGFVAYAIFIHTKLNILSDGIQLKGLFVNKKLKFHEIKGYKLLHSYKRAKIIVIVPNSNINKPIKIRPSAKLNFIELSGWIEKNFTKLDD